MGRLLTGRLKQWREQHGLTQEQFAERADLKYKHYQAIEAGRKIDIRISTLEKLARGCGAQPWELLAPVERFAMAAEAPGKYVGAKMRRGRRRTEGRRNSGSKKTG